MSDFKVLVDTVQQRLKLDGVSTLCGSADWDIASSTNVFQDGITGTCFLEPGYFQPAWLTSNSGIYAKMPLSSFTLTPSSSDPNWVTAILNPGDGQFYKYVNNTSGAGGVSASAMPANQAMVLEISVGGTTVNTAPIFGCGWGSSGDSTTGVALLFYGDYSCDVFEAGAYVGHYAIAGQVSPYGETDGQTPGKPGTQFVGFFLYPCRNRELLVICSGGGGFSHIFANIPEGTSSPIITPNAPFWFYAFPGNDQMFRVAQAQFASSGILLGKQSFWRTDPGASPTGGFQYYGDGIVPAGCAATESVVDGVTPTSAYINNTNGVRINVALSGTGTQTPQVFGARAYTLPTLANTVGPTPLDVTVPFVQSLTLEMSDSISGTRCNITLSDPKGIIAAGAALDPTNQPGAMIDALTDRPWQIYDTDGNQILEGISEEPHLIEGIVFDSSGAPTYGTSSNRNEMVTIAIRDGYYTAENFIFKDPIPLDSLSVAQAYTLITDTIGLTNSAAGRSPNLNAGLSTTSMTNAGNSSTEWNTLIQPGDRGSDWMDRIHKTYAGTMFHGLTPMTSGWWQPYMLLASDLPSTPALILYDSIATAKANGVMSPTVYQLFRTLDVQMLKPEANDIYVQGHDFRTDRPILTHKADTTNMDPTVPPGSRVPPWRGSRVSYSWNDPTLSSQAACNFAMSLIYPRVTQARCMVEFEVDFSSLLTRGALVQLYFASGGGVRDPATGVPTNPITARIRTVNAKFQQVGRDGSGAKWRPTKYTAQVGTDTSHTHTNATNLDAMQAEWALKTFSKTIQWGSALQKEIYTRPLILQAEA